MIYTPTEMALRNECEQLKKELAQVKAQYQACSHLLSIVMGQPTDMQVALDNAEKQAWVRAEELDKLRKDKARLDWLDNAPCWPETDEECEWTEAAVNIIQNCEEGQLRQEIDKRMI